MQRSSSPAMLPVGKFSSYQDKNLMAISKSLSSSYWSSPTEGVFQFQFLIGPAPLTNQGYPSAFQLIRFTPDFSYEAFQTFIQGRLNNDTTFEIGGGLTGVLRGDVITWQNGNQWSRINSSGEPMARPDMLNLHDIQKQAYADSRSVNQIYTNNYLY